MTEFFKGDALELKMYNSGLPALDNIGLGLDEFWSQCYEMIPMGEFLWDEKRVPLTNAIRRDVFVISFKQIFEAWSFCGTFESYILVFKKIFGDDSLIEFTVPAPGQLHINIEASGIQLSPFIARRIVDNAYVYDNVVDHVGDNIAFATVLGIETQDELEKVLYTMVPAGIYTEVSLTIGA